MQTEQIVRYQNRAENAADNLQKLADTFLCKYFDLTYDGPVYHYTSPDGLLGIVKNKGIVLRFTRYDCVNDLSEGKDVIRCFQIACEELLAANKISRDYYRSVLEIELDVSAVMSFNVDRHLNLAETDGEFCEAYEPQQCEAYICCFSKDDDSLPMWNYYSKKSVYQGYNVGIDADLMTRDNILSNTAAVSMEMVSMIYDEREKISDIGKVVEQVYKILSGDPEDECGKKIIRDELKKRMFRFKSQFFAHEHEIRFVLYVPVTTPEEAEESRLKIKYTSQNGYLIPFADLVYKKELLRSITVGPLMEKEISIRTLETIKTNYHYNYRIATSEVPIRF